MKPGELYIKNRSHNDAQPDRQLYLYIEDHHEEPSWGWFLGPRGLELRSKPDFDRVESSWNR